MVDLIKIEEFITAMGLGSIKVRLTVEFDLTSRMFVARLVDLRYSQDIAMLDVNNQHYLVGKGDTVEEALKELVYLVEMQYC